jgi:hypothetical protein
VSGATPTTGSSQDVTLPPLSPRSGTISSPSQDEGIQPQELSGHPRYVSDETLKGYGIEPERVSLDPRPILLLVGFVELNVEESLRMSKASAAARSRTAAYRDSLRIHAFRDLVGPDFVVLSLCDANRLLKVSRHCFELRYRKGMSLVPIRQRGFTGKVAHVFIDFGHRMLDAYLVQNFPAPLAIQECCPDELLPSCAIWLSRSPGSRTLLRDCTFAHGYPEIGLVDAKCNPLFQATINVGLDNWEVVYGSVDGFFVVRSPCPKSATDRLSFLSTLSPGKPTVDDFQQWEWERTSHSVIPPPYLRPLEKPRPGKSVTDKLVELRRGPERCGHPVSYSEDLREIPLLGNDTILPGLVPEHNVPPALSEVVSARHKGDHDDVWVGQSYHCPGGGRGVFARFKSEAPARYRICTYSGISPEDVGLNYTTAKETWEKEGNDYIFCHPAHKFIVQGTPDCLGYYANDGFHKANSHLWFCPSDQCVYVCLNGKALANCTYEILVNYGTPGQKQEYWTQERLKGLNEESRQECLKFYNCSFNEASPAVLEPPPSNAEEEKDGLNPDHAALHGARMRITTTAVSNKDKLTSYVLKDS